jgi:hypothetical protein
VGRYQQFGPRATPTEAVDHGDRNRSLLTTLEISHHPAQEQGHRRPDSRSAETDKGVPHRGLGDDRGDDKRGSSENGSGKDVPGLLVRSVRVVPHGEGDDEGNDVDRDGHD